MVGNKMMGRRLMGEIRWESVLLFRYTNQIWLKPGNISILNGGLSLGRHLKNIWNAPQTYYIIFFYVFILKPFK